VWYYGEYMVDNVSQIKERLSVVEVVGEYIKLQKAGVNFKARCPFHNEKTPSFFVSDQRQSWKCFGCGMGGDLFTFVQEIEGVEFKEALQLLARKAGIELQAYDAPRSSKRNQVVAVGSAVAEYFHQQLLSERAQPVLKYVKERGINDTSLEFFMVGYAPLASVHLIHHIQERGFQQHDLIDAGVGYWNRTTGEFVNRFSGRIIFPIANSQGNIVGFGGRVLPDSVARAMKHKTRDDVAKYINTPQTDAYDKSATLYGFDKAKQAIRTSDSCIVMEGYTDVILARQAGYENVVSASGTSLTQGQLRLIGRFTKNIITAFDMDIAGNSATQRGIELAQSMGFSLQVVQLEKGKDPADTIQEDPAVFRKALKDAQFVIEFYLKSAFENYDVDTLQGKRDSVAFLSPLLMSIANAVERSHWIRVVAKRLDVSEDSVWEEVKKGQPTHSADSYSTQKQPEKHESRDHLDTMRDEIYAHIVYDPGLIKEVVDNIPFIGADDTLSQVLQNVKSSGTLKKNKGKESVLASFNEPQQRRVDAILSGVKKSGGEVADIERRLSTILFEAERDKRELSQKTLLPLLAIYQKVILRQELQNLRIQIEKGDTGDYETLLQKVRQVTEHLNQIDT